MDKEDRIFQKTLHNLTFMVVWWDLIFLRQKIIQETRHDNTTTTNYHDKTINDNYHDKTINKTIKVWLSTNYHDKSHGSLLIVKIKPKSQTTDVILLT